MHFNHILLGLSLLLLGCTGQQGEYICTPCDLPCDELSFDKPGVCPHCQMNLIHKSDIFPELYMSINDTNMEDKEGSFLIAGTRGPKQPILVFYYKPNTFSPNTKAIMLLTGGGRNGREYMESWKEHSEKYNLLIIVPTYLERYYPGLQSYNLAAMISDVNLTDKTFTIDQDPTHWIYSDFDSLYSLVQTELSLTSSKYDMFGHSAGGQLLHRIALFNPTNNADRIVAANSGWYSLPSKNSDFPYGLNNLTIEEEEIDFTANLTVFVGALDDENEIRGHLRRTLEANQQGLDRLERGKYFVNQSALVAHNYGKIYNWKIKIVQDVGHDHIQMGRKAAEYLYEE